MKLINCTASSGAANTKWLWRLLALFLTTALIVGATIIIADTGDYDFYLGNEPHEYEYIHGDYYYHILPPPGENEDYTEDYYHREYTGQYEISYYPSQYEISYYPSQYEYFQPFSPVTRPFVFYKRNSNNQPQAGVQFTLKRWNQALNGGQGGWDPTPVATFTTALPNAQITINLTWDNLYQLVETAVPAGYQLPPGYWLLWLTQDWDGSRRPIFEARGGNPNFALAGSGSPLILTNRRYPSATLRFRKASTFVSPQTGLPLADAEFRLYPRNAVGTGWETSPIATVITGADGMVNLPLPTNWYQSLPNLEFQLRETAPAGFMQPPGYWIVTVNFCHIFQHVEADILRVLGPGETSTNYVTLEFVEVPHGAPGWFAPLSGLISQFIGEAPTISDDEYIPAGYYIHIPEMNQYKALEQVALLETLGIIERVSYDRVILRGGPTGPIMPFGTASSRAALGALISGMAANSSLTIELDMNFSSLAGEGTIGINNGRNVTLTSTPGNIFTWTHGTNATTGRHFHVSGGGELTLENVTLRGNAQNNMQNHGGVSVSTDAGLVMNAGSTIENNRFGGPWAAERGGGASISEAGAMIIMNAGSRIRHNIGMQGTNSGGGMYMAGTGIINDGAMIYGNRTYGTGQSGVGGGINLQGHLTMHGGEIRDNIAVNHSGGGVHMGGNSQLIMHNGVISGNHAGGINANGGGVHVSTNATFTMWGGYIEDNTSRNDGGGVQVRGANGRFVMHNGTIRNNDAGRSGGGVHQLETGGANNRFVMHNGTITGNRALNGDGGGVWVGRLSPGGFIMHGGTISYNTASLDGGGIFTRRYRYTCPIVPGAAGSEWVGIYDNIQISASANFYGNQARAWVYPPEILAPAVNNRLPHVNWNGTQSSVNSGGWLYLLNNYDINYLPPQRSLHLGNIPAADFPFLKTDHALYADINNINWPNINDNHLLAGANFAMFRWVGAGTPPVSAVVNPHVPGPNWARTWYGTSLDTGAPMRVPLDIRGTYFQLIEVNAPPGFTTPFGQWRLRLGDNCHHADCVQTACGDFYIRLTGVGSPLPPPFAHNPGNDIWYVGNLPDFSLPLTGGQGVAIFIGPGVTVIMLAAIVAVIYITVKRKRVGAV